MNKTAGTVVLASDQYLALVMRDAAISETVLSLRNTLANASQDLVATSPDMDALRLTFPKVIVALATLQSSVQDLSRAYINHANTVLNPGRSGTLDLALTTTLLENGLLGNKIPTAQEAAALEEAGGETKKKRKRAKHDPNAPKRALTPYFLYMQSARSQIARELGTGAKPKEVADEGTRRWGEMKDEDKQIWNEEYQKNLAVYRVKTAAYKAGQPVPDDKEAERLALSGKAPAALAVELEPEIEVATEEEEEEEELESSPEPVKEPSPPKSKRRKTAEKPVTPAKETPKTTGKASPEKKGKKGAAKKETTPPAPATKASASKKKSKKA